MKLNNLYNEQKEKYQQKTPTSKEAFEHAKLFLGGGETRSVSYYEPYPLCIDYGFGCEIYDLDGNKYIDCINNYTSLIHGHANPIVTKALCDAGGLIPADVNYLIGVRELCTQYNIVLVFDEVQSLRISTGGAQKKYGITPDLTALGKMIGGGLAVGAFGGKKEIMDIFDPTQKNHISQSGTFNGNRASMAAGVAAMNLYDEASCNRLESLAELLEQNIENSFKKAGIDGCVTRAGSLMNYHFIKEKPTNYLEGCLDNKDLLKTMHLELLNKGIFAAPRGTIALSTAMNESVIEYISNAFDTSLAEIKLSIS